MNDKDRITFKRMELKDIEGVVEVETLSFTIPWSRAMFIEELNNPNAYYFVAVTKGKVVAYAGMWAILDEAHITNIAVVPNYRRRHIASNMLRLMIKKAREKRLKSMTLEVRSGNFQAIALYRQFGFRIEGRRMGYYRESGEDAIIMWLLFDA